MLTVSEVKEFLNINDAPDEIVESAIFSAEKRIKILLGVETLPDDSRIQKAHLYLACAELAPYVNAYYKKRDDAEVLNAKIFTTEAERLLGLIPKSPLVKG